MHASEMCHFLFGASLVVGRQALHCTVINLIKIFKNSVWTVFRVAMACFCYAHCFIVSLLGCDIYQLIGW